MATEKVLMHHKSGDKEEEKEIFLQAITRSSNRKKVLVRFKFKGADVEFQEWMTSIQYSVLKTMDCLEFCSV